MKLASIPLIALLGLCAFQLLPLANSARILGLFAHPGKSHFDFFRPLLHELARVGHSVTVVSYFPNKTPMPNYTDYELSGMPIFADIINLQDFPETTEEELIPFKIPTFFMLYHWGMEACKVAFNSDAIKTILKSGIQYDVIILEQFNNDCMMAIAHQLKAPVIALSSCALMPWHFHRMGSPFVLSHTPMNFLPYSDEMNFVARLNNFVHFHTVNLLYDIVTQANTNALIREHFGPSVPPIEELVKTTSVMLLNQHFSLAGAYPFSPSIVEVGGLQIKDEAPLEPELKQLLDSATKGVIYISWGSMIRPDTLPNEKRDAILDTMNHFTDYIFLMKWSNATLPNKPKNLHTFTWLSQRDLLCHPNVKAFMTHGGLLGTSEAVYCGVPMIVTPFYGDQFLNSVSIEKRKMGVIVKYHDFTVSKIVAGLETILQPSFPKAVKLVSTGFKSRPQKPLDLSLWWVEHIIQTKGAPLAQSVAMNMNWFIYNSFEIYLLAIGVVLVLILLLIFTFKVCLSVFVRCKAKKIKLQ